MVKVKICGLMHPEDILAINAAQADFAGFVFAPGRHHVTLEQAVALRKLLHPDIQPVGVFVHESVADILAIYQAGAIEIAQLHRTSQPKLSSCNTLACKSSRSLNARQLT